MSLYICIIHTINSNLNAFSGEIIIIRLVFFITVLRFFYFNNIFVIFEYVYPSKDFDYK